MALKREMLKSMGLTDDQIATIIDGHTETVDALKRERDDYKARAEAADTLKAERDDFEKQLSDLKGGTDWKAEYDRLKADTEAKETAAKVKAAYRAMLEAGKIDPDMLDTIMDATRFDDMKLEKDGKTLKDAQALADNIQSRWAKFVVSEEKKVPPVKTPPDNPNGSAFEAMSLTQKMEYANQHPGDAQVTAWLNAKPTDNKSKEG